MKTAFIIGLLLLAVLAATWTCYEESKESRKRHRRAEDRNG